MEGGTQVEGQVEEHAEKEDGEQCQLYTAEYGVFEGQSTAARSDCSCGLTTTPNHEGIGSC